MNKLTLLEKSILKLVATGKGQFGWYNIETRLSSLDVPREPNAMFVLKSLAERDLVIRHITEGSPRDRWELTPAGEEMLRTVE